MKYSAIAPAPCSTGIKVTVFVGEQVASHQQQRSHKKKKKMVLPKETFRLTDVGRDYCRQD